MAIYKPKDLFEKATNDMGVIAKDELFSKRQHKRILESWCAGRFGMAYEEMIGMCEIYIEDKDEQRDYDFKVLSGGSVIPVQLAEVLDEGRKRGKEYQEKTAEKIAGELAYEDGVNSGYGVQRVKVVLAKKAIKSYAGSESLVVLLYANMMVQGLRFDLLKEECKILCSNFKEVWVMADSGNGFVAACIHGRSDTPSGFQVICN
jgi:hypothetical protein